MFLKMLILSLGLSVSACQSSKGNKSNEKSTFENFACLSKTHKGVNEFCLEGTSRKKDMKCNIRRELLKSCPKEEVSASCTDMVNLGRYSDHADENSKNLEKMSYFYYLDSSFYSEFDSFNCLLANGTWSSQKIENDKAKACLDGSDEMCFEYTVGLVCPSDATKEKSCPTKQFKASCTYSDGKRKLFVKNIENSFKDFCQEIHGKFESIQ